MKHTYKITRMTCNGCKTNVKSTLKSLYPKYYNWHFIIQIPKTYSILSQVQTYNNMAKTSALKLFLVFSILIITNGFSQETKENLNKVSKELVNPIGSYWTVNNYIEINQKQGSLVNQKSSNVNWVIQGVTPIPLNKKGLTLMNRPQIPIFIYNPTPVENSEGFYNLDNKAGIGDFTLQSALGNMSKTKSGMFMWGAGINLQFPTATKMQIGSGKYSVGPSGMLVGFTKKSTLGFVFQQLWSYAGNSNRDNVNETIIQFIYFFQIGNGWQVGDNPTWTFNWEGNGPNNEFDFPIGFGIFKTTHIGKNFFRFGITPRYYIDSYETWGNKWGINFTLTPVLKNPFKMKMKSM